MCDKRLRFEARAVVLAAVFGVIAAVSSAPAMAATRLSLNRFDPSPAGDRWFGADGPQVGDHLGFAARLTLDWAHNPLVFHDPANNRTVVAVVANQAFLNLGATLSLWDHLNLSVDLPVAVVQNGPSPTLGTEIFTSPQNAHIGDIRLGARLRFFSRLEGLVQLSLGGFLWIPINSNAASGLYTSDGQVRGKIELIAGGESDRFVWSLAIGPDLRRTTTFVSVAQGTMLRFAGGLGALVADRQLQLGIEFAAAFTPVNVTRYNSNLEVLAGLRYTALGALEIGAGAGPGLTSGIGTPDFRIVASLGYVPRPPRTPPDRDGDGIVDGQDACPDVRGVPASDPAKNGCPPPTDRDGDGIIDEKDACPDVSGVASIDALKNGCPPDRDGDEIADAQDACPDVRGVPSSDPAKNGCPPDRDGDGIIDGQDACPDVKGVASSDPAKNGCPPPADRDNDGIVDEKDACPDQAGEANPDPQKNGCPVVRIVGNQIILLEQVRFKTNSAVILAESEVTLQGILGAMQKLAEGTRFKVDGHTDNRGPAAHNRDLSLKRAQAVVDWLTAHGIAITRFDVRGFGPDKPLAKNTTEAGRQQNRRVEIHIVE